MKNSKLIMVCVLSLLMTGALNSLQAQDREGNRREMREKRGQGRGDQRHQVQLRPGQPCQPWMIWGQLHFRGIGIICVI